MPVDIEQVIDGARLGPLHWRVLILCALVTLLDGFDIQAMASATPSLAADWHILPGELRWIITAALIGIAASALIVSPLGDYFGRRTLLLGSFALVGVATLAGVLPEWRNHCPAGGGAIDGRRDTDRSPLLAGNSAGIDLRRRNGAPAHSSGPLTSYGAGCVNTSLPNTCNPFCPAYPRCSSPNWSST
jgi:Major Facilitator Superfamily